MTPEIRANLEFLRQGLAPDKREDETMSRGFNRATLVGNLGADPETRTTPAGLLVCNLSLAVESSWIAKTTGERQSETQWFRCILFGKLGEIAAEHLRKGSRILIEGRIQIRTWDDNGLERTVAEVVANELLLLDAKPKAAASPRSAPVESDVPF